MTRTRIRRARDVGEGDLARLYALHSAFFENGSRETFLEDFAEKDYVITADEDGDYLSFSTMRVHDETVSGERARFLFSGDTIVRPDCWSRNLLAPAFGAFLGRAMRAAGDVPFYWFLISKGYRTYMFLPVFFEEFYPRPEAETPREYRELIGHIARVRYGDAYDETRGVLDFGGGHDYLSGELAQVPASRSAGKYVSFFLERNPGYARGDELACIARLSPDNIKPLGRRLLATKGIEWETGEGFDDD